MASPASFTPLRRGVCRRAIAILVACVLILTGVPQEMTVAAATPCDWTPALHQSSAAPATADSNQRGQSPLHIRIGCLSELGCLLMVGIPPMPLQIAQRFSWAPVSYWTHHNRVRGITAEPRLDPPIV